MNRRHFLFVLTGAVAATVASLGARQGFAHGHHSEHHNHEEEHEHHSSNDHKHDETQQDSHYHHSHDDHDDHHHDCRNSSVDAQTGHHRQGCVGHDGDVEH